MTTTKNPETLVLHSGYRSDPATNSVAVPIYQTTSYQFDSSEHAFAWWKMNSTGHGTCSTIWNMEAKH